MSAESAETPWSKVTAVLPSSSLLGAMTYYMHMLSERDKWEKKVCTPWHYSWNAQLSDDPTLHFTGRKLRRWRRKYNARRRTLLHKRRSVDREIKRYEKQVSP